MKLTLFMAISANGYIARENGAEDFLSHENWRCFKEVARKAKNFIVGRKTLEAVEQWSDGYSFDSITGVTRVVLTSSTKPIEGWEVVQSPAAALELLRAKGLKQALLVGGASVNAAFLNAGLVDKVILNVEPVMISRGLNVVAPIESDCQLRLERVKKLSEGILQLHYAVIK